MSIKILKPAIQSLYLLFLKGTKPLYSGTGMVVMAGDLPLLVTSRQLVAGHNPDSHADLTHRGSRPDRVKIAHNRNDKVGEWVFRDEPLYNEQGMARWYEHPSLELRANIIALPISNVFDVALYPYEIDCVPKPEAIVGLTDQVSIVGYPYGARGGISFPVWSSGSVATEPALDHFNLPGFLIDSQTRLGQAGAPVLIHENGSSGGLRKRKNSPYTSPVSVLLGIYGGRLKGGSSLGIVWKVSAIQEIVDSVGIAVEHQQKPDLRLVG